MLYGSVFIYYISKQKTECHFSYIYWNKVLHGPYLLHIHFFHIALNAKYAHKSVLIDFFYQYALCEHRLIVENFHECVCALV